MREDKKEIKKPFEDFEHSWTIWKVLFLLVNISILSKGSIIGILGLSWLNF